MAVTCLPYRFRRHCVWPLAGLHAAATQTRARIIPVSPVFSPDALPAATIPTSGLGTGTECAGLHTLWLCYTYSLPTARWLVDISMSFLVLLYFVEYAWETYSCCWEDIVLLLNAQTPLRSVVVADCSLLLNHQWWRFLNVVRRHKLQQATRGRQWDGISDIPVITHGATGNAWFLWRKKSFRSHSLLKGLFFADCPRLYKLATVIVCHQKRNQVLLMPDNPQFRKKVHNLRIITHRYQQADYTRCELPVSSSLVASSDVNWLKAPHIYICSFKHMIFYCIVADNQQESAACQWMLLNNLFICDIMSPVLKNCILCLTVF